MHNLSKSIFCNHQRIFFCCEGIYFFCLTLKLSRKMQALFQHFTMEKCMKIVVYSNS